MIRNFCKIKDGRGFWAVACALLVAGQVYAASGQSGDHGWVVENVMSGARALAAIEASNAEDPEAVISGLMALAKARMDALQYAQAEEDMQRAIELPKDAFKGLKGDDVRSGLLRRVRMFSSLGDAQLQQGKLDEATISYEAGIHAARLGVRSVSPEVKHLRTGLACAVARRSVKRSAESLFEQLLAASERASGFVHGDVAIILDQWIEYRGMTGRLGECEEMAKRLVDVLERVYGSDHPEVAEALNRQASILYENGELQRAFPLLQRAYAIRRAAFGLSHPITKRARRNLGVLQDELRAARGK